MSRIFDLDLAEYAIPADELERILSPSLIVYLDAVDANIATLLACAGGDADRLRPHLKTTKIPLVWQRLVRAGIRNFKCATTREARHMLAVLAGDAAGGDLLVAYPHVGPALRVLGALAEQYPGTRLSVLCEDPELVAEFPEPLGVFVDVNPGMNRTGVPLSDTSAIRAVAERAGERFRGVHHYEGHVHSGTLAEREQRCAGLYADLLDLVATLVDGGIPVGEVVTSGSPSFVPALRHRGLGALSAARHRVSPGTVVYFDARYEESMQEAEFVPAALVLARVVSHPTERAITVDAGSKAIAAEAGDPVALVLGHPELRARTPSEEHLPFDVLDGERPPRGTPLLLVPRHVCPTVNLAEEAVLVAGGRVAGVVPVSARAHSVRS